MDPDNEKIALGKMRLSVQRLRWTLIAGAMLLVAVLAVYIGYGRYRAIRAYRRILAHSGVSLTHDSNGVTWSQSMKNRKLYTIRAKTESSLGDGKYGLHHAELLLYTRSEDHPDRIYGSEMEYDQSAGILRAKGEVFMDIQPPQALASSSHSAAVSDSAAALSRQVIHVRTSGLVYVRKLGIASTSQEVNFSYGSMRCQALGAEFNSDQSTVRLLANVHMDGYAHAQPLHIIATSADMDRNTNIANITRPVATSDGREARSDMAVLHLRRDGSIEQVEGINHVVLSTGTQQVTANRLEANLTPASILKAGKLFGNVVLTDSNAKQPTHGSAQIMDASFDAEGAPTTVTASGSAKLMVVDRRSDPEGFKRSMEGDQIVAQLVRGPRRSSSLLKQIHATGSARAISESLAGTSSNSRRYKAEASSRPLKRVFVAADDLRVLFTSDSDGKAQPQLLYGTGSTILKQDAPFGEQEFSSGDTLEMAFSQRTRGQDGSNISSAVQAGNVTIRDHAARKSETDEPDALSTGSANRAAYDGATQRLTLTGNVHLYGDNASLLASIVRFNQSTQDAEASGGVQTTFVSASPDSSHVAENRGNTHNSSTSPSDSVTHIFSASARFVHDTQFATFLGTDAQPAFMWRAGSQVAAATLFFNGIKRTFNASQNRSGDLVHAVFASAASTPKNGLASEAASIIHVASPQMNYDDLNHEAVFSEGVTIDGTMGKVRGKQAIVFLLPPAKTSSTTNKADQSVAVLQAQPSPLSGSIDRIVVYGSVELTQPGRRASGEELLYTAATQSYLLTGSPNVPPHIVDAQQGNVMGKALLFTNGGNTIVAAGEPNRNIGAGARVRTETSIGTAKEERQ